MVEAVEVVEAVVEVEVAVEAEAEAEVEVVVEVEVVEVEVEVEVEATQRSRRLLAAPRAGRSRYSRVPRSRPSCCRWPLRPPGHTPRLWQRGPSSRSSSER